MTAFELMDRMLDEERRLWSIYDALYLSEAEILNAELRHTVYYTVPRKGGKAPKLEDFARPLAKVKSKKKLTPQQLRTKLNSQLGIIG